MQQVSIEQVPNQTISYNIDGSDFVISLRSFGNDESDMILFATTTVNGEDAGFSQRCVPNGWIIPQPYLTRDCGNFRFVCDDEKYPYYKNFSSSCKLYYYDADEYKEIFEESR